MRSFLTFSFPLPGIDSEEFIEWCGANLVESDFEHHRHIRRVGRCVVSDDTVTIQFPADDSERVLFRLRWQVWW